MKRSARHKKLLRALEGTWAFTALEVDGSVQSPAAFGAARLVIDGDRFAMEDAMARYVGIFDIDVEADPHTIDVDFVEGPEEGKVSRGLFALDGDTLRLCIGLAGVARPTRFATTPGSGHALEVLVRTVAGASPASTTSATSAVAPEAPAPAHPALVGLDGEWAATRLVLDGKSLPAGMVASARRLAEGDRITVRVGGRVTLGARLRVVDAAASPMQVDYLTEPSGAVSPGILALAADGTLETCFAPPGRPRPTAFESPAGSGHTLSAWRRR